MRLLFSCVGRRVELIQAFSAAASSLRLSLEIHGADSSDVAPALSFCNHTHRVPGIRDEAYIPAMLEVVQTHGIDVLIPLLDPELGKISQAQAAFEKLGCRALISAPDVVETCRDKLSTHDHFVRSKIDTPPTWPAEELLKSDNLTFPYFMKPRRGSAGQGNYRIDTLDELRTLAQRVPMPIVQPFVEGIEHTLDAYTGFDGECHCVVPRRRLEVRGGEVSKSLVVMDPVLIDVGRRVIASHSGWRGVVTIQCIQTADGRNPVIEVNPRFGGGVPLAIRAGADFPRWILMEAGGRKPDFQAEKIADRLAMLRFDQAVYVDRSGVADHSPES